MLGPSNLIHKLVKSSLQLGNDNITYNTNLWDGNHYVLSLSSYSRHLETNANMFSLSFQYFTHFVEKVLS